MQGERPMLFVWMCAWSIFSANPVAAYQAEMQAVRAAHEQQDIASRLAATRQAVAAIRTERRI